MSIKFLMLVFLMITIYSCSSTGGSGSKSKLWKMKNVDGTDSLDYGYSGAVDENSLAGAKNVGQIVGEGGDKLKKDVKSVDSRLMEITKAIKKAGGPAINYWASDMFLKASWASFNGDNYAAMILLKNLHDLRPEDNFITKRYAIELIKVGKVAEAEAILENLIKTSITSNVAKNKVKVKAVDEKTLLLMAGVYTAMSKRAKAREIYENVLKMSPGNHDACIFYAKSLSEDEKEKNGKKSAMKVLENCEKKNRDKHEKAVLTYYRGKIALEQKKMTLASELFGKAMKLDPEYYIPVLALGGIYENSGKVEDAYGVYKDYLSKSNSNSGNSMILNKVVQVLFSLYKYADIIPYLLTLSRMDPDDLNIKVKLAILYTDTGNFEEAKKIFLDLLKEVPDSDKIIYYLGAIYEETKEFDKAMEYFSKVSADSPLFEDSNIQIGQILLSNAVENAVNNKNKVTKGNEGRDEREDREKRVLVLMDFIEKNVAAYPKLEVGLNIVKATYYEVIGDNKRAIEITSGLRKKSNYSTDHDYYLASLYEKEKNYDESYKILEEVIKKDPKNAHAWNFLGYSMMERGVDLKKALEYIKKAVALKPDDGHIRDSLGWYYYKVGKLDLALKEIKFARDRVDFDSVISKHLAMIYHALKNYNLAKVYYIEAYNNSKDKSEKDGLYKIVASMGGGAKDFERLRLSANSNVSDRSRMPASVTKQLQSIDIDDENSNNKIQSDANKSKKSIKNNNKNKKKNKSKSKNKVKIKNKSRDSIKNKNVE
ncbi:MAG: tetratricopeptide repeat protein [Oligoflexia bacterium]|nr:tetratricopeptide repeat protein [Oligoflexia bacterium]